MCNREGFGKKKHSTTSGFVLVISRYLIKMNDDSHMRLAWDAKKIKPLLKSLLMKLSLLIAIDYYSMPYQHGQFNENI